MEHKTHTDVVVVGAGMAGLYLIHRLRADGFSLRCFEKADGVGGTWYWNRYPGARCDIESLDYSFSFDAELDAEWEWSERYATQPEILRYLEHVADRFDLRSDITFNSAVTSAQWDDETERWTLAISGADGETSTVTCQHYIMATGCLSVPKVPDIEGADRFAGEVYFTSRWPHEGVDFTGKRVGVIGTGSSAIQSIPIIAAQADQLTVFQRTPNFSMPAHNGPVDAEKRKRIEADRAGYRLEARWSSAGVPRQKSEISALAVSAQERQDAYEQAWETGGLLAASSCFSDLSTNPDANHTVAEFVRGKIRSIVDDPATAEVLCPTSYPFATKRLCVDDGYYATFNRPNTSLVDLTKSPIETITETGIALSDESGEPDLHSFDAIVFATGFDAMTGALVGVDVRGRDGATLADKWSAGPVTYLGLMSNAFPNFFMVTGPGSPSVLSNMVVSIEQHVEWIADTLNHLREDGFSAIEPTELAETSWGTHVNEFADLTLYPHANSWYLGANVPGKPRTFLPYIGGVDTYRQVCDDVVAQDYLGFARRRSDGSETLTVDGVIRPVKPDVQALLDLMSELALPAMDSMSPDEARAFSLATSAARPPGPDVGEIVDGQYLAADGSPLSYRLYRPASEGPHPVVVYFHGGGWVLGSAESDDPLCRDLCVQSDSIIVSCDYRHAPEARFPAAVDDGLAAFAWVAANAASLGGRGDAMVVAGWSAGGNLAAVVAQHERSQVNSPLVGQVLLTPVTDGSGSYDSFVDNGDGYVLTADLMRWFWNHYADPADRSDPRASPLLAERLDGLAPALIVTAEFDPLRDEGQAYGQAMAAAGVPVTQILAEGQIHTSISAVDVLPTGASYRRAMAEAIVEFQHS